CLMPSPSTGKPALNPTHRVPAMSTVCIHGRRRRMSMLLNTAAAAAAITVGAGLLAARAQENMDLGDATCAEIVGLDWAQAERVFYFLAGLNEARILAARQGAQPETPADAMPAHSVSVDPDTNIDPLARRGSAPDDARVSFDQASGDRMESSEKLPR